MSETTESIVPGDYLHDDVQAVAEYRSVSPLAVLAAVLGLCSPVALLHPALLVVPLLGVILSVLALRRISSSEGQLAGRPAAIVGLALSLLVGTGVFAYGQMTNRLLAAEAERWALEWCDLVRDGQLQLAAELTNPPDVRRPMDDSLADYYKNNEAAAERLATFTSDEVVSLLTSAPADARVVPVELIGIGSDGRGGYLVAQRFQLVGPDGETQSPKFVLQLTRTKLPHTGGGAWHLSSHLVKR